MQKLSHSISISLKFNKKTKIFFVRLLKKQQIISKYTIKLNSIRFSSKDLTFKNRFIIVAKILERFFKNGLIS